MATDGRTHYEGCWKTRGHLDCAELHVAELEAKLAALQWTAISPDNLPKLGHDEVGRWRVNSPTWIVCDVADTPWKGDATVEQYANLGWTHFRANNAPLAAPRGSK